MSTNILFGSLVTSPPLIKTADYSQQVGDFCITFNKASSATLTLLPFANVTLSAIPGQLLLIHTITANPVVSASSNVIPLIGGSAGTPILAGTAGKWALLQFDGTNWQIIAGN